jgi:adenylylsulfate kinase-like enzyme
MFWLSGISGTGRLTIARTATQLLAEARQLRASLQSRFCLFSDLYYTPRYTNAIQAVAHDSRSFSLV